MAEIDGSTFGHLRAKTVNRGHIDHSPDESVHGNSAPVLRNSVTDHGSKTLATVAVILASGALGGLIVLAIMLHIVWAEYRLNNMDLEDMKAAMVAYGINPHPHTPGEKQ